MNKMVDMDFAEPVENPALKKLIKAWESKQARVAKQASGFGLMAVSLAACGSSGDGGTVVPDEETGNIFNLTTGADNSADLEAVGESGMAGDVFNAPLADASGSLQGLLGIQTLGGQDVIIGTDEVDVLNAELNATGTTQNPTITDVEILNFTVMPLPALGAIVPSFGAIDLHRSEGYEQLWNIDSRHDLAVINVRTNAEGDAPAIGLDGVLGDTTYTVSYDTDETVDTQVVIAQSVGSLGSGTVDLDINTPMIGADLNYIDTLDLSVSGGVYLNLVNDANWMDNLVVSGTGVLVLSGENDFDNLVTLDSTGYDEGLDIDVSGSTFLTSVMMGDGDDRVVVDDEVVRDTLSANMGAGADVFAINGVTNDTTLSALDFDVSGAQTLEFTDDIAFSSNGTLDLDGFSDLETISFQDFDAASASNAFTVGNAPETLLMTVSGADNEFDMDGGLFTIEGAVDLTVESTGMGDSDVRLDGGVNSETLETLVINAADDARLSADGGLDALTSIEVNALGLDPAQVDVDAIVNLQNTVDGAEFAALETVSVSAEDDADLTMNGLAPVAQVDILTFTGTQSLDGTDDTMTFNIPGIGNVTVTDIPDGGANWVAVASHIATELNGIDGISAVAGGNTNSGVEDVTITRDVPGAFGPITLVNSTFGAPGMVGSVIDTPGVAPAGFEAMGEVIVDAGDDSDVELTDVYGEFTLEVTAGDVAYVDLTNTNVVGDVTVTAGTLADVDVTGALHGNPNLETLTLTSDTADVNLSGDLGSFTTLDVSDVATNVVVNAGTAEYADGSVVTYLIGATDDGTAADDVTFTAEANGDVREVFQFTGDDIGNIVISNFDDGDLAEGDRDIIDFSQFASVSTDADLQFADANGGNDLEITAASDQFEGSIYLVGMGSNNVDANDLEQFNINYV